jgi:ribonuclease III
VDLVHRRALVADRAYILNANSPAWAERALGHRFRDEGLLTRALTHASHDANDYQRLEFLGDRVLGLAIASWLYAAFPDEPEGKLARRLNALVAGETCAEVARALSVPAHVRLGRQAREDGAADSSNVLGDVMEALIGAIFLDSGWDAAQALVRRGWATLIDTRERAPQHPKSALQEWAAARNLPTPVYTLKRRSGPHHALTFDVEVELQGHAPARASGSSKQDAETAAAAALLKEIGA